MVKYPFYPYPFLLPWSDPVAFLSPIRWPGSHFFSLIHPQAQRAPAPPRWWERPHRRHGGGGRAPTSTRVVRSKGSYGVGVQRGWAQAVSQHSG
jgi:hypothetical protein